MRSPEHKNEQGFMLVGLIVAIFIILLVLGVAAPKVARALRREREVEAIHRGNQYVRAIQLYYKKFGH
jgi:type II secretory pathway pseudopilin PulG